MMEISRKLGREARIGKGETPVALAVVRSTYSIRGMPNSPPQADPDRRILLVDCDAFFVQVARLEDPEGAGRAELLIVGGPAGGRGVVSSASYEARRFGVRSAMPTAQAIRLCPDALVVPVPRAACTERSAEVRRVLERFAPIVEAASIDEFYLDLTGTEAIYGGESLAETADRIRRAVVEETSIEVSVGGGTQRLIAKLAVDLAKPAGIHIVPPGGEAEFMRDFELGALPGIGPVMAERLRGFGLRRVTDALRFDEATLRGWIGAAAGRALYQRIRGIDPTPISPRAPARSISREETFAEDIDSDAELEAELLRLIVRAVGELRDEGLRARTITVKIRDTDFRTRQAGQTVDDPVESDRAVHQIALSLLAKLRAARRSPARLIGISLSQLRPAEEEGEQLGLFDLGGVPIETERDRTLARAVDRLRARFGTDAVVPGQILDSGPRRSTTITRRDME